MRNTASALSVASIRRLKSWHMVGEMMVLDLKFFSMMADQITCLTRSLGRLERLLVAYVYCSERWIRRREVARK